MTPALTSGLSPKSSAVTMRRRSWLISLDRQLLRGDGDPIDFERGILCRRHADRAQAVGAIARRGSGIADKSREIGADPVPVPIGDQGVEGRLRVLLPLAAL